MFGIGKTQIAAQKAQIADLEAIVALDDPERLLARVRRRVQEGGHDVPPAKILARYPRTLVNLSKAAGLATVAYLYEARELEGGGPQLVAMRQGEKVTAFAKPLPPWAQGVLGS